MSWCIFVYLGKIIVIILRCWLLQLTTIHITKLQHPSHKKQTTLETIQISYASFLLLFAYRWPLLLHWRVHRWARSYTWIYLVLKKDTELLLHPIMFVQWILQLHLRILFLFFFFFNRDQIPNSYRVAPHSILQVVLVLIYGLKSSRILATSSVTYSNSLV